MLCVFVSLKPDYTASKEIENKIKENIIKIIGPIVKPKNIYIVPDMPKTRLVKIMRLVLSSIYNYSDVVDVATLVNPEIVETICKMAQEKKT